MSFLVGLIVGGFASYLIVSFFSELKLRLEVLEDAIGFDKEQGLKWLSEKNPGIGLRKPADLNFHEFYKFVREMSGAA